jgi:hypothetical protein
MLRQGFDRGASPRSRRSEGVLRVGCGPRTFAGPSRAMGTRPSGSFSDLVVSAFPRAPGALARTAEEEVETWVDQSYRTPATRVEVNGEPAFIPYRIHFAGLLESDSIDVLSESAACLLSRSTDGHLRQRALGRVLATEEAWAVPYVVLPLGEYVVEIGKDIFGATPRLNRGLYGQFVRENRSVIQLLRARAVSYWNCYYRHKYPDRRDYPPLAALSEIEAWAI